MSWRNILTTWNLHGRPIVRVSKGVMVFSATACESLRGRGFCCVYDAVGGPRLGFKEIAGGRVVHKRRPSFSVKELFAAVGLDWKEFEGARFLLHFDDPEVIAYVRLAERVDHKPAENGSLGIRDARLRYLFENKTPIAEIRGEFPDLDVESVKELHRKWLAGHREAK